MRGCGIKEEKLVKESSEMSREERISQELQKLKKNFTRLDAKTKKTVENLINNAAFMAVTLEDLQKSINLNGAVSEYQNGENQWGTKKSPEVEIYNTMIKNYASVIKQLTDLLPKPEPKQQKDELEKFINNR